MVGRQLLGVDYVGYQFATAPRLSGRVIRVGAEAEFKTLEDAWPNVQSGDTIRLGPGEFDHNQNFWRSSLTSRAALPADLQFIGGGPSATVLKLGRGGGFRSLHRIRFADMAFDLLDEPLMDLRNGDAVQFVNCRFLNYNSGSGGSNSLYASNGALLIERCIFDGRWGRARPGRRFGTALDLRGSYAMFARQCEFVDNDEISRTTGLETYDACVSVSQDERDGGVNLYTSGQLLLLRDNQVKLEKGGFTTFALATDDRPIIDAALGREVTLDALSQQVVNQLGLARRIPYWRIAAAPRCRRARRRHVAPARTDRPRRVAEPR